MNEPHTFDVIVVGGGPSGATAAHDLARQGRSVLLLDRAGRVKPCGGAIPPRLIKDFDIPDHLLVAKIRCARMVSPTDRQVDIPIDGGFVGMVDRDVFDEWLRERAAQAGAVRRIGTFDKLTRDADGVSVVHFTARASQTGAETGHSTARARCVIGADGARSEVACQVPSARPTSSPTTRSLASLRTRRRATTEPVVTWSTTAPTPPISMAGCSRMATP
jgi:geranylgeranyl reductase